MLTRIQLSNFKLHKTLDIGLAPLTLLTGLNGSGKSSLLQALALIVQSHWEGFLARGQLALNGSLVSLGTGGDLLCEESDDESITIIAHYGTKKGTEPVEIAWGTQSVAGESVLSLTRKPSGSHHGFYQLIDAGFQYLQAERAAPATLYETSSYDIHRRRFLGIHGEYTAHYLSEYRDEKIVDRRRNVSGETKRSLDAELVDWMQRLNPGVRIGIERVSGADAVRLGFTFPLATGVRSKDYRPTNIGFGVSYALPIVTACLATPTLHGSRLLMVENPEAHLHPSAQVEIARLLSLSAASGAQVLLETHSDHIVNGIRLAVKGRTLAPDDVAIHYFSHHPESHATQVESPIINADGKLDRWPEGFLDQWELALFNLVD